MSGNKYIVYVFARNIDSTTIIMGCTLDLSSALDDINKRITNDKYYCYCGYYVESRSKGEDIINFIVSQNPKYKVLSDYFLFDIPASIIHKFLKDIAAISGREDHLLEPKEAFRLSKSSSGSTSPAKEVNQIKTKNVLTKNQQSSRHSITYDDKMEELHQFASSGEMNRSKATEVFFRLGQLQKKSLIGKDKRKTHYCELNYDKTYYSVYINKSNIKDVIYIILNDSINRILYLFALPKSFLDLSLLKQNETYPDQYSLQILYNDPDFKEFYSSGKISLKQYLVTEPFSYWPEEEAEDDILYTNDRPHFKPTHYKEEKVKAKTIDHKELNESFDADKYKPLSMVFNGSPDLETLTYSDIIDRTLEIFFSLSKDKLIELVLSHEIKYLSDNKYSLKDPLKVSILQYDIYFEGSLSGNESLNLIRRVANELDINVDSFIIRLEKI